VTDDPPRHRRPDHGEASRFGQPTYRFVQVFTSTSQNDARVLLKGNPHALVTIVRGTPRAVVFHCPCGCGDVISINLDPAAGHAWRYRATEKGLTLLPSVWRTTGCESHFIIWNSAVWWCGFGLEQDESEWPGEMDRELREEWSRIRQNRHRDRFLRDQD
jgi:hypothetical protein